jgi:hypothetical protein
MSSSFDHARFMSGRKQYPNQPSVKVGNKASCTSTVPPAMVRVVWNTVNMTTQTNQPNQQHREDYKVQKLVDHVESKLALQAKAVREAKQGNSKN